jgi:hypothetical protein
LASQQLAMEALAAKVRRHEELLRKLGPTPVTTARQPSQDNDTD